MGCVCVCVCVQCACGMCARACAYVSLEACIALHVYPLYIYIHIYAYTCMRRGRQWVDFQKCQVIFGKDFCWCRGLFEREVCQLQVSLLLLTMLVCSNVHLCVWMCVCRKKGVVRACVCAWYSVEDAEGGKHAHALSSLLFRSLYLNTRMLLFSSSLSLYWSLTLSLGLSVSLYLSLSDTLPRYLSTSVLIPVSISAFVSISFSVSVCLVFSWSLSQVLCLSLFVSASASASVSVYEYP